MADMWGETEYLCVYVSGDGIQNFGLYKCSTKDKAQELARKDFGTIGTIDVINFDKTYYGWTYRE